MSSPESAMLFIVAEVSMSSLSLSGEDKTASEIKPDCLASLPSRMATFEMGCKDGIAPVFRRLAADFLPVVGASLTAEFDSAASERENTLISPVSAKTNSSVFPGEVARVCTLDAIGIGTDATISNGVVALSDVRQMEATRLCSSAMTNRRVSSETILRIDSTPTCCVAPNVPVDDSVSGDDTSSFVMEFEAKIRDKVEVLSDSNTETLVNIVDLIDAGRLVVKVWVADGSKI